MDSILQWNVKEPQKTGNWETDVNCHTEYLKVWKAKHFKDDDPRVEIKKLFMFTDAKKHSIHGSSQALITIRKNSQNLPDVVISMNGKLGTSWEGFFEITEAIKEAMEVLL